MFGSEKQTNTSRKGWIWFFGLYFSGGIVLYIIESIVGKIYNDIEFILVSLLIGVFLYCALILKSKPLAWILGVIALTAILNELSKDGLSCGKVSNSFTIRVTGNSVRIRSAPSPSSSVIGSASGGHVFKAQSINNGFYQIEYEGRIAYISIEHSNRVE